jgi:glycosyltransferase involved in cell wall biosynthesis
MMASNAFILPSRYEGLSNALLEAMASQLPIIASNVGGNPDLIIDNFSGYLFPKEDIDKLSSLLTKIITDFISGEKDRYKELGLNAKRIVKEKFDLKVIANRYIELYQILALKQK